MHVLKGDTECVDYLLEEKGVDVDLAGNSGITALHMAAMCGHAEVGFILNLKFEAMCGHAEVGCYLTFEV